VAEEIARRAARLTVWRRDGSRRGVLARPAWRHLLRAGEAGDWAAHEAVWLAWLRSPEDTGWELLARWRGLATVTEDACDEAIAEHGAAAATVAAFCARRGLVPADPVRRAAFLLLSGQAAQLRAADPDGALIALAYAGAGGDERARLRTAMAEAGDLDLVRVVTRGGLLQRTRAMAHEVTADEVNYLTAHLAQRKDWPGLWSLARDLPLTEAIAATRRLEAGWRPASEPDLELFGLLARADPGQIAGSGRALQDHPAESIEVPGKPIAVSFSPDGRRVAIATEDHSRRPRIISVRELPRGTLAERYELPGTVPICLLDLGGALIAAEWAGETWYDSNPPPVLIRYAAGRGQVLLRGGAPGYPRSVWLAAHPAGFAALDRPAASGGNDARLIFYTVHGLPVRVVLLHRDLGLAAGERDLWRVATNSGGRLLALAGRDLCLLDGQATRVLATRPLQQGRFTSVCFPAADVVATTDTEGHIRSYRLVGNGACHELELLAEEQIGHPVTIAAVAGGEIAIGRAGARRAEFRDAGSLAPVGEVAVPPGAWHVWGSPDGRYFAAAGTRRLSRGNRIAGSVNLVSIVPSRPVATMAALPGRPMAAMTPGDLAALTAEIGHTAPAARTRPFLDLLRACLEHRFADVAISPVWSPPVGSDDIGL
jgi:hypothetical protein